jgi:D-alanyl-D-alanine carboxypeptidase
MGRVRCGAWYRLHCCVLSLAAVVAALVFTSNSADAWHYRRIYARHAARAPADDYSPLFASIVVDGNSGEVLQASNVDAPRHPASLTKIMTLYLLFERLDAGKIKLNTPLEVSAHASEQAPTKLGLKPGQTIAVEDAIKAVVTKSANDAAVAIAENLAGDESEFAKLMTQKAHALGMSHTTYVNASGLPDDDQVTTARDQALLGRAIQERFPRYYKYFSTADFVYRGTAMRNHNHLLGVVGGVDGIKTGYTRSSGFNLVTSVHRDGRYIVAVVLGGRSAFERDARMRELINTLIKEAALRRTAPILAEGAGQSGDQQPATPANTSQQPVIAGNSPMPSHADATPTAMLNAKAKAAAPAGSSDPIQPVLVKTITYRTAPMQTASLAPMPALVPATTPPTQPTASAIRAEPAVSSPEGSAAEASRANVVAAAELPPIAAADKAEPARTDLAKVEPAAPQTRTRSGWLIQVGAFESEDEAKEHLSAAQQKVPALLATADSFTELVQKGDKGFYRARFAGLEKATAEAVCKLLKRSAMECMVVKN